jgi:energy-converting hydrogenase Eha subunit C
MEDIMYTAWGDYTLLLPIATIIYIMAVEVDRVITMTAISTGMVWVMSTAVKRDVAGSTGAIQTALRINDREGYRLCTIRIADGNFSGAVGC